MTTTGTLGRDQRVARREAAFRRSRRRLLSETSGVGRRRPRRPTRPSLTTVTAGDENSRRTRGRRGTRALAAVGSIVSICVLAHLLGAYLPETGQALTHLRPGWLVAAVAAALISMAAFSELQRTTLRAGGTRVSRRRVLGLTFEANAVSGSLPAGSALAAGYTFRRFRTWGSSAPLAGYTLVMSGLISTLAFGVLAALAAAWAGGPSAGPVPLVLAGGALAAAVLGVNQLHRHPEPATRLLQRALTTFDRLRRRPDTPRRSKVLALITATAAITPTARIWSKALLLAAINWTADIACLLAATHVVGAHGITLELVLLTYIAGMGVSSVSLVPGGLGIVEAAMLLVLTQAGTAHATAIASVLVYRLVSYALIVGIGWALLLIRTLHGHRPAEAGAGLGPPAVRRATHRTQLHETRRISHDVMNAGPPPRDPNSCGARRSTARGRRGRSAAPPPLPQPAVAARDNASARPAGSVTQAS